MQAYLIKVTVWFSGNAFGSICVVALRRARLVLGWVTACGRVKDLGICNQPVQLSLASLCGAQ